MPSSKSASSERRSAGDRERAKPGRGVAQELLEPEVLVRELQRLDQKILVGLAVDAEQTDTGCDRRLRGFGRRPLQTGERLERPLVADSPQRQRRIVLQRSIELRDDRERVVRVLCLVFTECLDDRADRKKSSPRPTSRMSAGRSFGSPRGEAASAAAARTSAGRTNSPCSLSRAARISGASAGSGLRSK